MAKPRTTTKNNSSRKRSTDKSKQGCAVSFLNEERGELDKLCESTPEESTEVYKQPRKEKEAGGEG